MSEWVKNWELTIGILHFYAIFSYKHHSKQLNNTIFGYPDPKHTCVKHVMHLWLEDVYDWVVTTKHQHIKWISHQNPTYILHIRYYGLSPISTSFLFCTCRIMSLTCRTVLFAVLCFANLCTESSHTVTYTPHRPPEPPWSYSIQDFSARSKAKYTPNI